MLPFKLVCARTFYLPIGQSVFPVSKYRLMCEYLLEEGIAGPEDFVEPAPASDEDVLLVHTPEYVHKLRTGTLSESEASQLEVPYSRELVEAYWLCVGGTILAADCALRDGVAFNLSGGFHHAFPDHGEGFNLINDVAVTIRRMQKDGKIKTAMAVDCDVHHGNGTAAIFGVQDAAGSPRPGRLPYMRESPARDVFTISLHQENNYPAWKPPSAIDVGLSDGIGDDEYLAWLERALMSGLQRFQPDLICYLAGSDPYRGDLLGGLALTIEGRSAEMSSSSARLKRVEFRCSPCRLAATLLTSATPSLFTATRWWRRSGNLECGRGAGKRALAGQCPSSVRKPETKRAEPGQSPM